MSQKEVFLHNRQPGHGHTGPYKDQIEGFEGRSATAETERSTVLEMLGPDDTMLEIGTLDGVTVGWWAKERPDVNFVSIDLFAEVEIERREGDTIRVVKSPAGNIGPWRENSSSNQVLIVGTLPQCLHMMRQRAFDLVFVDGAHTYTWVLSDLRLSRALLKPHGVFCVHDYGEAAGPLFQGVTRAVDEFCEEAGYVVKRVVGMMAVLEKKEKSDGKEA